VLRGREGAHVLPDLGQDGLSRAASDAWRGLYERRGVGHRGHGLLDADIERRDVGVQGIDQGQVLLEQEGVVRGQPATLERLAQGGPLLPQQALRIIGELVRIVEPPTQGLENGAARLPHDVRGHAAELEIGQL
jgi:hypothetical protein